MFQGSERMFNPTSPLPGPDQARRGEGRRLTEQIIALCAGFVDDDDCDCPRGGTHRRQPGIAEAWHLRTVPPSPISPRPQVLSGHAAAIRQLEDIPASLNLSGFVAG